MSDKTLVDRFIKELKNKIYIKSSSSMTPEKALLESFKYYDYRKTGLIDYKTFLKMVKIKLSINVFKNEEIMIIFDNFQNKFGSDNSILYRNLIKDIYNVDVTLKSVRSNLNDNISMYSKSKSFTNNKNDKEDDTNIPIKLL